MPGFKEKLAALRLWESNVPLVTFLEKFGNDPYRDFIQYRIKDTSARDLQDAALDDWAIAADALGIPVNLEIPARISGTLKGRFLVDPSYWTGPKARSCVEAVTDSGGAVDDEVDLGESWHHEVSELDQTQQRALLGLFMFGSNLFAGLASESKLIRRHLGLRKGLFG